MKTSELLEALKAGPLAIVEWRGSSAREFTNTEDGQSVTVKTITHLTEMGDKQITIKETIHKDNAAKFSVANYNAQPKPFKKGELVLWRVGSYGWSGTGKEMKFRAGGSIEKID